MDEVGQALFDSRDDADEWGEPSGPAVPKKRLSAMVSIRLSEDEMAGLQAKAAREGRTVSAYLRGLVVKDLTPRSAAAPQMKVSGQSDVVSTAQWPAAPVELQHA